MKPAMVECYMRQLEAKELPKRAGMSQDKPNPGCARRKSTRNPSTIGHTVPNSPRGGLVLPSPPLFYSNFLERRSPTGDPVGLYSR